MKDAPIVRKWHACPDCGRPFWRAEGESWPAHRVTDDGRLSVAVCPRSER